MEDPGDSTFLGIKFEASPFTVGQDFFQLMEEAEMAGCDDSEVVGVSGCVCSEGVGMGLEGNWGITARECRGEAMSSNREPS